MRPQVVGSACIRVQSALDAALAEGVLQLPPELAAHAERCARCAPEVNQVSGLLGRLRSAAAGLPLGRVPSVVDVVVAQTRNTAQAPQEPRKRPSAAWMLSQVGVVAAALLILISGVSYALLKVNQAVSGTQPAKVVERLTAPLSGWSWAKFRNAK